MRSRLVAAFALLTLMLASGGGYAQSNPSQEMPRGEMHTPAPLAGPLKITYGDQSAEWTPTTLASLPHTSITVYNEHAKANQTYSGVPLIDLLTKLGVPDKPRGKQFRLYVVASGADGYEVVYSLGEVTPDVHDGTVLVADSQDGKPLGDDGPLKMVVTGEKRPARWVRNLAAIRVLTAE
ncbi:MAG TPA: molybdopterin-dependent oxidoreductase [Terracidiphilus sp.]|nr:molybdopterin-dependent oxidoreductase [Terracidiphilus sp.]